MMNDFNEQMYATRQAQAAKASYANSLENGQLSPKTIMSCTQRICLNMGTLHSLLFRLEEVLFGANTEQAINPDGQAVMGISAGVSTSADMADMANKRLDEIITRIGGR